MSGPPGSSRSVRKRLRNRTAEGTEDHFRNFFACIGTRKQPIETVEFGCGTAVACHMANISYRKKQRVFWDAEKLTLKA